MKRIQLPVLHKIKNSNVNHDTESIKDILNKFKEESNELIEAIEGDDPVQHQLEEIFDNIQVCINFLDHLSKNKNIDIEKAAKNHIQKLRGREWEFSNIIDCYIK